MGPVRPLRRRSAPNASGIGEIVLLRTRLKRPGRARRLRHYPPDSAPLWFSSLSGGLFEIRCPVSLQVSSEPSCDGLTFLRRFGWATGALCSEVGTSRDYTRDQGLVLTRHPVSLKDVCGTP